MRDKFFVSSGLFITILLAFLAHPTSTTSASRGFSPVNSCGSAYVVRAGDTLSAIAARCGVSLSNLTSVNGLRVNSIIYPGQRLAVPGATTTTSQNAASTNTTYAGCPNPYVVRAGDTLSIIASRCGVTVYTLKQRNGLRSDLILIGQSLYVQGSASRGASVAPTPYYYSGYSGVSAAATPMPYLPPATVDYLAPYPTPTPQIESPISLW